MMKAGHRYSADLHTDCALLTRIMAAVESGKQRGSEEEWEVVEKAETLRDSSYVGPATFASCVATAQADSSHAHAGSELDTATDDQQDRADESPGMHLYFTGSSCNGSNRCTA
jgi:hypothetical protein